MRQRNIPIIRLHDTLLVSIQIELSDRLVSELKENITAEVKDGTARGLVIEISGVDILDSYIARSLRDISQMVKLMGVDTIIVGLDPAMAHTLVEMGLFLTGISTALNLETALDRLAKRDEVATFDVLEDETTSDIFLMDELAELGIPE